MAENFEGTVSITRTGGSSPTIKLDGANANVTLGGDGQDGDFHILDGGGNQRIRLRGDEGYFEVRRPDATVLRVSPNGNVEIGGAGLDGNLILNRADGRRAFHLEGAGANLWIGGRGEDGDIVLFPHSATELNNPSQATIHLDASRGDITLGNADSAEDFDIEEEADAPPGTVMVITHTGSLRPCSHPYDGRVAGVVAGAGSYRPGIVMDRREEAGGRRLPIALSGKVFCHADATDVPIEVGNLLTTSASPGYAMRAVDPTRAFGAVIGKALGSLDAGRGLVPILVALQ